eukprot:6193955-Pleurochrysis_carterae.AAC.2
MLTVFNSRLMDSTPLPLPSAYTKQTKPLPEALPRYYPIHSPPFPALTVESGELEWRGGRAVDAVPRLVAVLERRAAVVLQKRRDRIVAH